MACFLKSLPPGGGTPFSELREEGKTLNYIAMKGIFCLMVLLLSVFNSCSSKKYIERSDIHNHVKMDVLFYPDSMIFGGTLNITIILKNISRHPVEIFSDANVIMERWAEGTFISQSVFLNDFTTNFKLKETILPQESFTKEYKVPVVSPFFYIGEIGIRFLYLAKPSKKIIDKIYEEKNLKVF
jgi:hypothetical protein